MDDLLKSLSAAEQRAVQLVKAAFDGHNSRDGTGLFTGPARYAVFEERARLAAIRSRSVRQWWALTCQSLKLPLTPARLDAKILSMLSGDDDHEVLRALSAQTGPVVMIARALHSEDKAAKRELAAETVALLSEPEPVVAAPSKFIEDELPL